MILAYPHPSWKLCALCLLIAVAAGAYRRWCLYFGERIEILPTLDDGDKRSEDLHLDAYVPGWKSNKFRIGLWLLVAACSTLGAAWGTVLLRGVNIQPDIWYFLGILLTRWVLSALLGTSVANYALRGVHSFPD
jgi:hypothetical protein